MDKDQRIAKLEAALQEIITIRLPFLADPSNPTYEWGEQNPHAVRMQKIARTALKEDH